MKGKINPRLTEVSLTFVLFVSMVIVPNMILGIYGYLTLRAHESEAETNMNKAYGMLLNNMIDDVNKEVENSEESVPRIVNSQPGDKLIENLDEILHMTDYFKHVVFIDYLSNETFEKSIDANDKEDFDKKYKTPLIAKIDEFVGNYPTRFVVESTLKDNLETFYCVSVNSQKYSGVLAFQYDQQGILEKEISKMFKTFESAGTVDINLSLNGDWNSDEEIAFQLNWKGKIFPYWQIIVEHTEEYKSNKRSTSSFFLMMFGLLLPLVGAALIGLRKKLLREMREAHLKTDFISRVSHELRTPLTSIKMFSEMLDMDSIPEEQKRNCIDIIQRETERLAKLVDRVLNFSKLESRNKVFTFEKTDIEKLVVETVRFFEKQIPDKDFKIKLLKDPRIRDIMIDKDGIREILLNLIENSYKYSSDDKEITVKIQKVENDMRISVIDNGFGIPREDLNRVFQKFYRVDDQINRGIDGTGLGLSICLDIAKAHGGTIMVESERGAGSKFIVSIPLRFNPAQWAKYMVHKKYPWE